MKLKMWIKAVCAAFVLTVLYSVLPFQAGCAEVPNEVFRLHILANSDSEADQQLKLSVRDRVISESKKLFENAGSREEAERTAASRLKSFENWAEDELRKRGCFYEVRAEITNMYFDTRHYESYTLPPGKYDALRLTIGEGKGHNWWCVMYPSLCLSSPGEQDGRAREVFSEEEMRVVKEEKREYKFKIVELFEKLRSFFG